MQKRFSMIIMLALFICLGVFTPVSAQVAPLPAVGQTEKVFVSPSVLRAMQGQEKDAAPSVEVIVTFASRRIQRASLTVEDISTARAAILSALPAGSYEVVSTFKRITAVSLKINELSLDALRTTPGVVAINLNNVVTTQMAEANAVTGVASVHTGGITGQGVVVAIIDTGVDSNGGNVHPALDDDLIGQACFRTENDCIGGASSAEDQDGHGTHVAGMITGPEGVAPDAQFYALKVFTTGSSEDVNILNALDFVIDTNATTPGAIDIVNMSLGGDNYADQASCDSNSMAYVDAFSALNAQNVTIFVATGNDGQIDEVGSPGCVTGAVGVGSTGDATFSIQFSNCTDNGAVDKVSCFSNATPVQGAGELLDMMAPGCDIISTGLDGATNADSCGTSMATPYAAGTAALLLEYLNDNSMSMTPAQIEEHMETTGVQISDYRMPGGSPTFPRVSPPAMIGAFEVDVPTNFTITAVTSNSVSTSWTAAAGATEYRVYASKDGGIPTLAGTVTAPTTVFVHNAPVCGTLTYFVRTYNGQYESANSNTDTDTARACPLTPSGLQLSPVDGDTHNLAWTDHNPDETANILQRQVNDGGFANYQTLAAGVVIQYTEDGLACGIYDYRAISQRNGDLSYPSNTVQRAVCAPANDNFANAEVVTANTPYTDTEPNQSYATEEAGDPIYSCHFDGADGGYQGVWYRITPASNTRVTVSTAATTISAPSSSNPDTLVAIYTGSFGSLTEIACNEDISGSNYRSTVKSNLNAGTTYYVFVSQWVDLPVGTMGNLVVDFTWSAFIPIPANDLFANTEVISDNIFNDTEVNMLGATLSAGDPDHSCIYLGPAPGHNTVWYSFTPDYDGLLDIDTDGSTNNAADTVLSIFTGTYGNFTEVDCDDDSGVGLRSMLLDVPLTGGTPYTIYISLYDEAVSASTLMLDFDFTPDPAVVIAPTTVEVTEGGTGDGYEVFLTAVPTANVTITITDDVDCSASADTLTFTPANYMTPQTVTVTAVDDALLEGSHACTISHTVASSDANYNAISVASVTGTVTDDDSPSVTVAPTDITVTEGGATAGYEVMLDIQPTGNVTVTVTDDADCSASVETLTFTSANYMTPQPVTVTAVDDTHIEGEHTCTISHGAAGGSYTGVSIASVTGTITDDEVAAATTELLTNTGFETAGTTNGLPAGWTVQKASGDKRACPLNANNIHGGTCAFKFTGSLLDVSKLIQTVDLTGHTFLAGDTLTASAFFKGNHTTAKVKVTLFVYYTGNTTPVKTSLNVLRNPSFTQHTLAAYTLTNGNVSKIKLVFNHMSNGGTVWVDDASLLHHTPEVISRDGALSLPAAPDGFRK